VNKYLQTFINDVNKNPERYRWIFIIFLLVYFGEVIFAKVTGSLTSPERQFWYFWFFISVLAIIPYQLSIFAGLFALMLIILTTTLQLWVSTEIAIWVFLFLFTALISVLIQAKKDHA